MKTCKQVSEKLNCSGKTIRKWAGILFKRNYPCWLFSEKQIEILKTHIHNKPGRPKNKNN
jgi:uncharacterized protein YjcR